MKKVDSRRNAILASSRAATLSLSSRADLSAWRSISTIKPFGRDLGAGVFDRKKKKVYPHPAPLNPKRKSDRFIFLQSRGEPRTSASSTRAEAGHYCPPYSHARAPRSGRESVRAYARDLKK